MMRALLRPRTTGTALLAVLAVAVLVLAGCSSAKSPGAAGSSPAPSPTGSPSPSTTDTGGSGPVVTITSSPPTIGSPAPSSTGLAVTGVAPGHGSPAAANAGFLNASVKGDFEGACAYALPSEQPTCKTLLGQSSTAVQGSPLRVGNVVTNGNQALVTLLGTICASGAGCVTNTDPNAGLPANAAAFAAAYENALNNFNLTQPCQQSGGQWYIDLGNNSGVTV